MRTLPSSTRGLSQTLGFLSAALSYPVAVRAQTELALPLPQGPILLLACAASLWVFWRGRRRTASLRSSLQRAEQERASLEQRMRAFVDDTSDLTLIYSLDGRVVSLDPRGMRTLGVDPAQVERLSLRDLVSPSHLPLVSLSAADCVGGSEHWGPFELSVRTAQDEELWLLARVRALFDGDRVQAFELVGTSIHPQKSAQLASAHGSALLRKFTELTSSQGSLEDLLEIVCEELDCDDAELWSVDDQFDVLRLTHSWRRPTLPPPSNTRKSATLGKGFRLPGRAWIAGGPQLAPDLTTDLGPESNGEAPLFRSGLAFPVRLAGEIVGILALHRSSELVRMPATDLMSMLGSQIGQFAQRQRAEQKLRYSEARNRAILECTAECVITTNERGEIIDFNPAAERTFGHARSDILGKPVLEVLVPPELREEHQDVFSRYLDSVDGNSAAEVETFGLRADGSTIPIEVAVTRVLIGGQVVVTAFMRDITQRKEVQRLKDELVSTVSHELRTPLASVRGFVELLLLRDYPKEEQQKFLCIIDSELKRLTRLINDFLDLQRIEDGQQTYDLRSSNLIPLLQDCVEVSSGSSAAHAFELDCDAREIWARIDVDRIQQVLMNLLSNAVKFSPDGGSIRVQVKLRAEKIEISVRDSGLGMTPEVVSKLFSKFYRADSSATRKIQGTGLGLALVREIVVAHGGEIHVESEPGVGSTFSFTLERTFGPDPDDDKDLADTATKAPAVESPETPSSAVAKNTPSAELDPSA